MADSESNHIWNQDEFLECRQLSVIAFEHLFCGIFY